jgi:caa(3)-type oxidase subunit IV
MSGNESKENRHVLPLKTYLMVAAALFILTGVTVGVSFIHLGGWNAIAALGIASIKAMLVAFVFMHLWYDRKIYLIIFTASIIFLAIFLSLTMFDVLRRGDIYPGYEQPIRKEAKIYDNMQRPAGESPEDSTASGH